MVDGALFDKLEVIARKLRGSTLPFGGIQLVLCGDFLQVRRKMGAAECPSRSRSSFPASPGVFLEGQRTNSTIKSRFVNLLDIVFSPLWQSHQLSMAASVHGSFHNRALTS